MDPKYNFPKVELHCHLDGCYRVETVAELAKKRGAKMPSYDPNVLRDHITVSTPCASLPDYLNTMAVAAPAFAGDAEALKRITKEAIEDKARNGTAYVEMRYSPQYFANTEVVPDLGVVGPVKLRPRDAIEVVNSAVREAEHEYGIKVRTILCCITLYNWGMDVAQLCREYKNQGVVGIDIAGPESDADFPDDLQQCYEYCRQNGIHRTAHAGEVGPGSRVRKAVKQLHAERIGHGYHVIEDAEGYQMAKNHVMHMEVCPLSSHFTGAVKVPWSSHPAKRFFEDGVNFSMSTDDPGVHRSEIIGDYDVATKEWEFSAQDLQHTNLNAAKSCFLDDNERQQLVADLKKQYQDFNRRQAR